MNASDGSVSPSDRLKAARARLSSAEASVISAKRDAKAAKDRRKEAKDAQRRAKKHLRRAKKELREAKRVVAAAEESQRPPPRLRRLRPIEPVKTQANLITPPPTVRAKKKPVRKRVIPALKRNGTERPTVMTPPVETNSAPLPDPPTVVPTTPPPPT